MENSMDLSSVVSLIMKHPELIETIAALAKSEGVLAPDEGATEGSADAPIGTESERMGEAQETMAQVRGGTVGEKRENRKRLFSAIRPFLSDERAKTLSSVEAMVSILDTLHS